MKKKTVECREYGCTEAPHLSGLCKNHHKNHYKKRMKRNAAINSLRTFNIDGHPPENKELRNELRKAKQWWDRACCSVNHSREDEVLSNEAKYVLEWCILIAQEIIDEELMYRDGKYLLHDIAVFKAVKKNWWEQINNLEEGVRSNGLPRSEQ